MNYLYSHGHGTVHEKLKSIEKTFSVYFILFFYFFGQGNYSIIFAMVISSSNGTQITGMSKCEKQSFGETVTNCRI